jgi:N-acetylglucosaminyldiphosphoundecaprenol N-acetyl-beta-D-mannosaminyltransferase
MARDVGILLGVAIDRKPLQQLLKETSVAVKRCGQRVVFACANPHSLVTAQRDRQFLSALNQASHVVADGVGVSLMAKMVGVKIGPRITGSDFFIGAMRMLEERGGGRVFFFGSSQRVLNLISARCARDFPRVTLCGMLSPPYGAWSVEENAAMLATIREAQPDVLWVGMTAPKQEKWVAANCAELGVPVIGSIGAVFDFFAGTYPRAPDWMCRLGIEWVYRLAKEPQRMWRRNIVSSPLFVLLVLRRHLLKPQAVSL